LLVTAASATIIVQSGGNGALCGVDAAGIDHHHCVYVRQAALDIGTRRPPHVGVN
jgi:hypothetical protein